MIDLTPEAKTQLNEYVERMRSALRGTRAVEPDEVEQNVREHVEIALSGIPAPVGAEPLARVLEQLGPPERWLPEDDRPAWKRFTSRIIRGPEDWRLAYLTFGVTFLMVLFFPVGGILLLPAAFLLARAHVELMAERGEPLGARRWLVLPPIFLVALFLVGTALFVPIGVFIAWINEESGAMELMHMHNVSWDARDGIVVGYTLAFAGAWWIALSAIYAVLHAPFTTLIKPFGARWKRARALILTAAGVVVGSLGAYIIYLVT